MNTPLPAAILSIVETSRLMLPESLRENSWPTEKWLALKADTGEIISYISHNSKEEVESEIHETLFSLGVNAPYFLIWKNP